MLVFDIFFVCLFSCVFVCLFAFLFLSFRLYVHIFVCFSVYFLCVVTSLLLLCFFVVVVFCVFVCRYEKQLEQEEESYQQQRRRLYSEIQEEKQRLADSAQKLKHDVEEMRSASEETQKQALCKFQEEHRHEMNELLRKHEVRFSVDGLLRSLCIGVTALPACGAVSILASFLGPKLF